MTALAIDYRLQTPISLHATFEIRGFTALLGRSGAGKTSLLKALAGLLPAIGTPWAGLAPEARPLGYLPQNAALFPHLNVVENTAYALRGANRFNQAQTLLNELGLGNLATRPAAALSGGQAQQVALARALARSPNLLLLDEPCSALDSATRDSTLHWLIETLATRGIPALAATHDTTIASLADWLSLLDDGHIVREGSPAELFNNPQSGAAARLLGFDNIWRDGNQFHAVRATDIEIAAAGVPATVISVRPLGAGLRVECAIPHRIIIHAKSADLARLYPGASIFLKFHAVLFQTP